MSHSKTTPENTSSSKAVAAWTVDDKTSFVSRYIRDESGAVLAKVYAPDADTRARLMAAAPELYEALKKSLAALIAYKANPYVGDIQLQDIINAALRKAEGK